MTRPGHRDTAARTARPREASGDRQPRRQPPRQRRRQRRSLQVLVPLVVAAAAVAGLHAVWPVPGWVGLLYAGMSLLTYAVYAKDKAAARDRRWRVAESTLHVLSLLGGWPGALLAQQVLRHKTVKRSFRGVFWCTVVANLVLLAALCSPAAAPLREAVEQAAGQLG